MYKINSNTATTNNSPEAIQPQKKESHGYRRYEK
jgi:hypothetical protein